MSNTSQFSLANRKQLADMLGDKYEGLRYKAKQKFRKQRDELQKAVLNEYVEKKGATTVVTQIKAAQRKLSELELELKQLGFELHYGDLRLHDESSNPLDDLIDARVEKEIGSESDVDARFDSAQIAMMTIATLQDAEKLLKSVTEI